MRVSQLIATLQQLQAKHGDKPVFTHEWDDEDGTILKELQDDAIQPIDYRAGNEAGIYGIGIDN